MPWRSRNDYKVLWSWVYKIQHKLESGLHGWHGLHTAPVTNHVTLPGVTDCKRKTLEIRLYFPYLGKIVSSHNSRDNGAKVVTKKYTSFVNKDQKLNAEVCVLLFLTYRLHLSLPPSLHSLSHAPFLTLAFICSLMPILTLNNSFSTLILHKINITFMHTIALFNPFQSLHNPGMASHSEEL